MHSLRTTRFRRGKLPHWEVQGGRYFITLRLADSLPRPTILRLKEIHSALAAIDAQSEQFAALQRQYFLTLERHLDAGAGSCALRIPTVADGIVAELRSLTEWHVDAPHFSVMPNHCHVLLTPTTNCTQSLAEVMKRIKGRTGWLIRNATGRNGPAWQREWFDRWLRSDAEYEKTLSYIRNNPVKAGLAGTWSEHPWTK